MGQGQSDEGKIKGAFLLPGKEPDFSTCKHLTSGNSFMILRLVLYHGSKRQNKRVVFWRQWEGTTPPPHANRWQSRALGSGVGVPIFGGLSGSRAFPLPHTPVLSPCPKPAPEAHLCVRECRENWVFEVFNIRKSSRNPRNPGSSAPGTPTFIPEERRGQAQSEGPGPHRRP